jgi:hypothetical protein
MIKDIDAVIALQGRNLGLVVGRIREGITLSGSGTSWTIPAEYLPIFPRRCVSLTPTKDDITLYDDGVETDIASVDFETGVITSDSSLTGTITADFVEEFEPHIAQNIKCDVKQDSKAYGRIRSDTKTTSFGAKEITIGQDNLLGDTDSLVDFAFEDYTGDETVEDDVEVFEMVSEPRIIYAYIVMERGTVAVARMYFPQVRAIAKTLVDVKEGDNAQFSIDIAIDKDPLIVRPKAST